MTVARLVNARHGEGDDIAALELIDEALQWWPDFTDLVFERAAIRAQRGDREGAMRDALACIDLA